LQHVAVAADPWPGAVAVWRSADGESFGLHSVLPVPAILGRTLSALSGGPVWSWDERTRLEVEISSGGWPTVTPEAALAGETVFAVRGQDGGWEVLAARSADLIGPRRYRLSGFLRGLGGTEHFASRTVPAGADLVRLDGAVAPLSSSLSDLGRTWTYRIGPADRGHADPAAIEIAATIGAGALKPLAPVHPRARRVAGGVAVSWIRRARLDGDGWEMAEIPLGEEVEAYELAILDSLGGEKRAFATAAPAVLYGAADELADFGVPQAELTLRIAQLSRTAGRGHELLRTVPVL
ncbi:MAG: hypothetical protein JWR86_1163, partial [Enterovirga sp.]|nr:hypothetical protein [Enterovirga sp.]